MLINKTIYRSADGGGGGGTNTPLPDSVIPAEDASKQPTQDNQQKQPENPMAYWQSQAEKYERLHKKADEDKKALEGRLSQLENEVVKSLMDKYTELQTQLENERKLAQGAITESLRVKVMSEFKLGAEAVGFLTATDEAGLRVQAEALTRLTGKPAPTPTGNVGNPASDGKALTIEDVRKMSLSEVQRRKDEIREFLAKGK